VEGQTIGEEVHLFVVVGDAVIRGYRVFVDEEAEIEAPQGARGMVVSYFGYAGTSVAGLGEDNEKALRFLLEFSTDKDEVVRNAAASAFVYIGVRAIPILKDGLKDKSPVVRAWTIGAFTAIMRKDSERAKFPADAILLLTNAINDESEDVATSAIYAVSQLGFEAREAIPVIVKRFKDPDWQVRQYAIRHVEEFGPASELAIPALKDALKDEHGSVREAAQRALAAIEKAKKAKTPKCERMM
jgi:HEAT repeat protein